MHLFAAAASKASATPSGIVEEVVADVHILLGGRDRDCDGSVALPESAGTPPLRDDAIRDAVTTAQFRSFITAAAGEDTTSVEGRRKVLEYALTEAMPLNARVVCYGEASVIKRHPALGVLNGLRGELGGYLGYCQAVEPTTGAVPDRATAWNFAGRNQSAPEQMNLFLKQRFSEMDPYNAPCGVYALRQLSAGNTCAYQEILRIDFHCNIQCIRDLDDFMTRSLTGVGVPAFLLAGSTGFTFSTFCSFYIKHLEVALTLHTPEEQLKWLTDCSSNFLGLRQCCETEMQRVLFSSAVATERFGALMPYDGQPAANLRRMAEGARKITDAREVFDWLGRPSGASSTAINPHTLPLISELQRRLNLKRTRDLAVMDGEMDADLMDLSTIKAHGALAHTWMWLDSDHLLISGWVWAVRDVAEAHNIPVEARCWPVLLTSKVAHNKLAICAETGDPLHANLQCDKHAPLPGFDPKDPTVRAKYTRRATNEESQRLASAKPVPLWVQSGRGRGGGARGQQELC